MNNGTKQLDYKQRYRNRNVSECLEDEADVGFGGWKEFGMWGMRKVHHIRPNREGTQNTRVRGEKSRGTEEKLWEGQWKE